MGNATVSGNNNSACKVPNNLGKLPSYTGSTSKVVTLREVSLN